MAKFKDKKKYTKLNNDKLDAEFKKARQEVFRFGVKHLNKKDKESTKYDQLVRLGAEVGLNSYSLSFIYVIVLCLCGCVSIFFLNYY